MEGQQDMNKKEKKKGIHLLPTNCDFFSPQDYCLHFGGSQFLTTVTGATHLTNPSPQFEPQSLIWFSVTFTIGRLAVLHNI